MNEITPYTNWADIDQLDHQTLHAGEVLIVEWPNGEYEQVTVKTEVSHQTISDMGSPYNLPISKSYVEVSHKGAPARVYLAGMKAQRVR